MLPEKQIEAILKKFGPEILAYLEEVGFFDVEGPYEPADLFDRAAMADYLKASKAKNTEVWGALEKYLLPEMADSGAAFIKLYGLKKPVSVQEIATDYVEKRGGELIKRMTKTDKQKLTNYIWYNSAKNERPLARQILKEPHLGYIISGHRAETIIRTERGRAIRSGSQGIAIKGGANTKTWQAVGDKRTRPSHMLLSGQTFSIEEDIPGEGQYPGEISINCRCWLEYGFDRDLLNKYAAPSDSKLEELYA